MFIDEIEAVISKILKNPGRYPIYRKKYRKLISIITGEYLESKDSKKKIIHPYWLDRRLDECLLLLFSNFEVFKSVLSNLDISISPQIKSPMMNL
jgi:hypothetical protein